MFRRWWGPSALCCVECGFSLIQLIKQRKLQGISWTDDALKFSKDSNLVFSLEILIRPHAASQKPIAFHGRLCYIGFAVLTVSSSLRHLINQSGKSDERKATRRQINPRTRGSWDGCSTNTKKNRQCNDDPKIPSFLLPSLSLFPATTTISAKRQ